MKKFNIGDLVQVVSLTSESEYVHLGDIGIVEDICPQDLYPIKVDINDEVEYGFKECEIEHINVEDVCFDFEAALELMILGIPVKLPEWQGYWIWEEDTIMIHTKEGGVLDFRNTDDVYYTMSNILRDDWQVYC